LFQGSTVKVGSKTMQINGELLVNDFLDVTGRLYYFGSGFAVSEARLSQRVKISSAESFVDFVFTSDHPSMPEARFMVTAEILATETGSRNSLLFSLVTPFSRHAVHESGSFGY
jgi:hypothetical protein